MYSAYILYMQINSLDYDYYTKKDAFSRKCTNTAVCGLVQTQTNALTDTHAHTFY